MVGEWPEGARLPGFFASIEVKDAGKARRIVDALTAAAPEPNAWSVSDRDGVRYYSQPPPNPMVPVAPTIAHFRPPAGRGIGWRFGGESAETTRRRQLGVGYNGAV